MGGNLIVVPLLAVTPVFVRQLPVLVRGLGALLEALQLFLLRDVQPEFQQQDAAVHDLAFEIVDLAEGPAEAESHSFWSSSSRCS